MRYTAAAKTILARHDGLPDTREILRKIDELEGQRQTLMEQYRATKAQFDELAQHRRNYDQGIRRELER